MTVDIPRNMEKELEMLGVIPKRVTPTPTKEKETQPLVWDGVGECPF